MSLGTFPIRVLIPELGLGVQTPIRYTERLLQQQRN